MATTLPFSPLLQQRDDDPSASPLIPVSNSNTPTTPVSNVGVEQPQQVSIDIEKKAPQQQPEKVDSSIEKGYTGLNQQLLDMGSNTSTLGQILAWVSAVKGDFKGLLAIEDSKRQTALGKAALPTIQKINDLANTGKWQEANALLAELTTAMGPRADKIIPYFQQMAQGLAEKQKAFEQVKSYRDVLDKSLPANAPERTIVESLNDIVNRKGQIDPTMLNNLATRLGAVRQVHEGQVVTMGPTLDKARQEPLTAVPSQDAANTFIGQQITSAHGLATTQDVVNVLRGNAVKDVNGQTIEPNSAKAQQIRRDFGTLQQIQAEIDLGTKLNIDPAVTFESLKEIGLVDTARRSFGKSGDTIINNMLERKKQEAIATTLGPASVTPDIARQRGMQLIDSETLEPIHYATDAQLAAAKGRFRPIPIEINDKVVQPSRVAMANLDRVKDLYALVDNPNTPLEQLGVGVVQTIRDYLGRWVPGFNVDSKQSMADVARAVVDHALDSVQDVTLPRTTIANMKKSIIGNFANAEQAAKAADQAKNVINDNMKIKAGLNRPFDYYEGYPNPNVSSQQGEKPAAQKTTVGILQPMNLSTGQKIIAEAHRQNFDPAIALAVFHEESLGEHREKSGKVKTNAKYGEKGGIGAGQLVPSTAKEMGVDPYDEDQNIRGSIGYMVKRGGKNPTAASVARGYRPEGTKEDPAEAYWSRVEQRAQQYRELLAQNNGQLPAPVSAKQTPAGKIATVLPPSKQPAGTATAQPTPTPTTPSTAGNVQATPSAPVTATPVTQGKSDLEIAQDAMKRKLGK